MIPNSALQGFRSLLRGQSFCPDEPGCGRACPNRPAMAVGMGGSLLQRRSSGQMHLPTGRAGASDGSKWTDRCNAASAASTRAGSVQPLDSKWHAAEKFEKSSARADHSSLSHRSGCRVSARIPKTVRLSGGFPGPSPIPTYDSYDYDKVAGHSQPHLTSCFSITYQAILQCQKTTAANRDFGRTSGMLFQSLQATSRI